MPKIKAQRILLDGYNNPGFSGSPVVFRDLSQSRMVFKVAGVVSGYLPNVSPVMKEQEIQQTQVTAEDLADGNIIQKQGRYYRLKPLDDEVVKLNTGIAVAWDISSAVELIRRHPTGPKAVDNFTGAD
jgi:hypothetical protein